MQALKALVVFLAILIFIAMGFLVYGLLNRGDGAQPSTAAASFGLIEQRLPAGASVSAMTVDAGRAIIHVKLADGGAEIRIFDLASGAALGIIRLNAAP